MCLKTLVKIGLFVVLIFGVESDGETKDIIIEGMEMLEGDYIMKLDIELDKIGPTKFVVNGTLKHFKAFDDDWKILFEISHTKDSEEEEEEPFIVHYPSEAGKGICEFLKEEYKTYFYETLKDYSNAPHYETCPLEPKEYIVTNYSFDADLFKKFLFPGHYEVVLFVQRMKEVVRYKLTFSVQQINDTA